MQNEQSAFIEQKPFKLHSEYKPTGDQPQAIAELLKGFQEGNQFQTLLEEAWGNKILYEDIRGTDEHEKQNRFDREGGFCYPLLQFCRLPDKWQGQLILPVVIIW